MKLTKLTRVTLALLLATVMLVSAVACTPRSGGDETDSGSSTETPSGNDTSETTSENTSADTLPEDVIDEHTYDFYITLGTMPTLYATLNA